MFSSPITMCFFIWTRNKFILDIVIFPFKFIQEIRTLLDCLKSYFNQTCSRMVIKFKLFLQMKMQLLLLLITELRNNKIKITMTNGMQGELDIKLLNKLLIVVFCKY